MEWQKKIWKNYSNNAIELPGLDSFQSLFSYYFLADK